VFSMGREDYGVLGIGSREDSLSGGSVCPTFVESLRNKRVTQISCGGWHSILMSEDGEFYSCGKGEYGRLGVGDELSRDEPIQWTSTSNINNPSSMQPDVRIKSISAGGSHSLILSKEHKVYAVGRSGYGRLGVSISASDRLRVFTEVKNPLESIHGSRIVAVEAGGHTRP